jgi:protein-disulfide isomerase-like protein with CxxC motif
MNAITEYYIEEIARYNYILGSAVSAEEIQQWLKKTSGDYFANGKDTDATFLRNLSEEVGNKAESWRKQIDTENLRSKVKDAWDVLEKVIKNESYPEDKRQYKE